MLGKVHLREHPLALVSTALRKEHDKVPASLDFTTLLSAMVRLGNGKN